jgi:hypothetical protein
MKLKERLKAALYRITFGEGVDAGTLIPRKPEDSTWPWFFVGVGGAAVSSEEILMELVESYAKMILTANAITTLKHLHPRCNNAYKSYNLRNCRLSHPSIQKLSTFEMYAFLTALRIRPYMIIVSLKSQTRVKPMQHVVVNWLRNDFYKTHLKTMFNPFRNSYRQKLPLLFLRA